MTTRALKSKASDISRIARSHGVSRVRVFGSHATGRAKRTSDVDLLITLQSDRDLLDLVEFKLDVQDLLGCDVDVVTENGLSPYLRRTILRTAKPLCSQESCDSHVGKE